jgi:hypothetical protein
VHSTCRLPRSTPVKITLLGHEDVETAAGREIDTQKKAIVTLVVFAAASVAIAIQSILYIACCS